MNDIVKIDGSGELAAFSYPDDHPVMAMWMHAVQGFLSRLDAALHAASVHPSRTLVLLPYAQLRPLAARLWTRRFGDGFAPRFETTMNWTSDVGAFSPVPTDIRMDATWDSLSAQSMLAQAGLAEQQTALAGLLVQTAHQLAPLAAACPPSERPQWARQTRQSVALGMASGAMQWELAVAGIAVEWAALSNYPSDLLFEADQCPDVDCLVMVRGIANDPLAQGLKPVWGERLQVMALQDPDSLPPRQAGIGLHACHDAEDEAQRCAAQALARIAEGTFPLALVSSDRALTRRVRALLDASGVAIRDENGWKLSTSHAAAGVMALLQACAWNATSDQMLNWLKRCAPDFAPARDVLEVALRRDQVRDWRHAANSDSVRRSEDLAATLQAIELVRSGAKGQHTLAQWLGWLRSALTSCGMWQVLETDAAGAQLAQTLGLLAGPGVDALLSESLWSQQRMDLSAFSRWVNESLEAQSFKPEYPEREQVVILPMSQMLGRPFAAVLLAGCDEVRLLAAPEPPGIWTAAQREALGLPSRDALQANQRAAWHSALQTPVCDVFWRSSDESGEALLPSPLVQLLQESGDDAAPAADQRVPRPVDAHPTAMPQPTGEQLPVSHLTQGAYDDLRHCPYRFFALRQLGLKSVDELEQEVDKRDFGVWLHAVLQQFHTTLALQASANRAQRQDLLEAAALEATRKMGLDEGEFLPFAASWPAVREAYLDWLQQYETTESAVFASGETDCAQQIGPLQIRGRVDRVDHLAGGVVMVLDYKTESSDKTRARISDPLEDTQMAFYAALLPQDTLRGAYVNISEKKTATIEQADIVQARDALIEGMLSDMQRIAEGAPLPALGQGKACDYCDARGLCRKDFWGNT
jgi:ATP-dependent helicase/nuclease subunit B